MSPRKLLREALVSLVGCDAFDRASLRSVGAEGPGHPITFSERDLWRSPSRKRKAAQARARKVAA